MVALIAIAGIFSIFLQNFAITSDQLTLVSLVDDIFRNSSFNVHLWLYPRASYFFPDFALVLLLKLAVHSDVNAAWLMQCYQLVMTSVLACLVLRQLLPARDVANATKIYGTMIVAVFIWSHYAPIDEGFIYPFVSFSHAGALTLALIGGLLFAKGRYVDYRSPANLSICTLLTVAGMVSDKTFVALFSMPAVVVASLEFILTKRMAVFPIVAVQLVGLCSMLVIDYLLPFQVLPASELDQIGHHLANIFVTFRLLPLAFQLAVIVGFLNVLAFSVVMCRRAVRRRPMDDEVRLGCFLVASVMFNAILCIVLWAEPILGYARYAVMLQFTIPLLLAASLASWLTRMSSVRAGSAALFAAAAALVTLSPSWGSPFKMVEEQNANAFRLKQCVRTYGLHSGLAQYWLARKLSSSTNWSVQIDQLQPAYPQAFFWGSNLLWFFLKMDGVTKTSHDFVIVDGFTSNVLETQLGIPLRYVDCNNWRLALYDEKTLDHRMTLQLERNEMVAGAETYLPPPVAQAINDDDIAFGLDDLSMRIGQRTPAGASVSPTSGGGYFLYGPYARFAAGSYRVAFNFNCTGSLDGTLFDVSADGGKQTLGKWLFSAHQDVCDGTEHAAAMNFDLPRSASLVETHAIYGGTGHLTVTSLQVSRSEAAPAGAGQ